MALDYNTAQQYRGKMVRFRNEEGNWVIGKVMKVDHEGMEIQEFHSEKMEDGFGYGWFGRRPFWGRPFVRPFRPYGPYGRYPYAGVTAFTLLPFLFW